jgi:hypothetical protein
MKNLAIVAMLVLAACAQNPSTSSGSSPASAEADVLEAVFRYQFEHNASGIQQNAERYCLTLPSGMPDTAFLRRFEGNTPPVTAADQCDKTTGKDLFFEAKHVEWVNDGEATVHGGYWEGNLSSSGETFKVVREEGLWVVKEGRLEVIS